MKYLQKLIDAKDTVTPARTPGFVVPAVNGVLFGRFLCI